MAFTLLTVDTLLANEKIWIRTVYDKYILEHDVTVWLYTNAGSRRYLKNEKDPGKIEVFNDKPCWGFWIIPVNTVFIPDDNPKIGRFFFTDRNAAILFKLTWGGL